MEKIKQTNIAKKLKVSDAWISQVVSRGKIPNWKRSKQLAAAVPGTTPVMWIEGTEAELRTAIENANKKAESMAA